MAAHVPSSTTASLGVALDHERPKGARLVRIGAKRRPNEAREGGGVYDGCSLGSWRCPLRAQRVSGKFVNVWGEQWGMIL